MRDRTAAAALRTRSRRSVVILVSPALRCPLRARHRTTVTHA
ncbi:hypothetical protein [Streptomyces salinarius]|nr:hypothetical protein [Streptomyces salinarius]